MKMQLPQPTVDKLEVYRNTKEAWINAPFSNSEKERKAFKEAQANLAASVDFAYKIFGGDEDKILPGEGNDGM